MREHQIVITLKPDQFLEVQRLARAANAKSMGAFVRQKLLAALGIEGTLNEEQAAQVNAVVEDVDVEAILVDLKRMHAELKTFVAESLSPYSPEAFGQVAEYETESEAAPPAVAYELEQPLAQAQPQLQSQPQVQSFVEPDELEKLADRTFAISPRLGPIGDPTPTQIAPAQQRISAEDARNERVSADDSRNERSSNDDSRILLSRHELHSRRDTHRYHTPTSPLDAMDESFTADEPQVQQAEPIATDAFEDILNEEPLDDAPPAVPYRPTAPAPVAHAPAVDPLSKLLSVEDMKARAIPKTLPIDEDDDHFDVPLSIAERRRLLTDAEAEDAAAAASAPYVYKEPPHPALQPTLPSELPLETPAPAPIAAPITNEVSSSPAPEPESVETSTTPASSPTPPVPNPPGAPLGYPPLSGSPPPKRRQL